MCVLIHIVVITNIMVPNPTNALITCDHFLNTHEGKMWYIFRFLTFLKNLRMSFDTYYFILSLCQNYFGN